MAFSDFLDLRTAVLEQVGRTDIADVFPRLTLLAEAYMSRKMEMLDQITTVTVTFSGGVAPLPNDFSQVIGLFDTAGCEYVQQPTQIVKREHTTGFYAIEPSGLVSKHSDGDLTLQYYAKIPTITAAPTDSNWLLQRYPSLYLYAVAYEAAKYMRDRDLAADMRALRDDEMRDAMADDSDARYARARVRVAGVTP